ncbi:MAG: pyridoxamine 5'-phosphate oxidase family protein [Rhodospirillales bacterium]|nr:pyridoxamine 5'-phosphate oxidase family protein [Rhodospirillales bacterium]
MSSLTSTSPHPVLPEMPNQVVSYLKAGALGIAVTVGDDGYPTDSFCWVVANDAKTLRIGADHGGKTQGNLQREGRVAVQIVGPDNLVFLIKGTAKSIKPNIDAVPMDIEIWEVDVVGARDQSWPGAAPLPFFVQWSGDDREDKMKTEQAAFEEMRKA